MEKFTVHNYYLSLTNLKNTIKNSQRLMKIFTEYDF